MDAKITKFDSLKLYPPVDDSSEIAVLCFPEDFCASRICRAVEDCDAHVLNLNLSGECTPEGRAVVYLRVNRLSADSVARSLERFGYSAVPLSSEVESEEMSRARTRANELIRYLEI